MLELNYKTYGQGPALIILHGLFGSLDNWVTHARNLSDNFTVYLIDQRNHGRSPHAPEMNYAVMAEDLYGFMDQHGIYKAHLLGHSMGGKAVMKFALEYPDQVDKLLVADMGIKSYPPHHTEILQTLADMDLTQFASRQQAQKAMEAGIPDQMVQQFLLKSLGRDENKQFRWKFNLQAIRAHYGHILEEIDSDFPFEGTTLFLSGGKSSYVEAADWAHIQALFPQAKWEVLPTAGHWLHADQPAAFLQAVRNFLQ
ncbi:MAG: alpha/beta fold hydrolase [Bacteroidota bacterium]